ncbi:MAG TPA: KTSC domain-containing protein [Telluria sp.]
MEMKKINAGKLRAIGYDARERVLRVEFDDGSAIDYSGVGSEVWRRLSTSGSAWSFYRDNIEEEFAGKRGRAVVDSKRAELDALFGGAEVPKKPNPLDQLFGTPDKDTDGA